LVAYQDRSASFDGARGLDMTSLRSGILDNVVVLRGQVWGGWKRRLQSRQAIVELGPLDVLEPAEAAELEQAAERLGRFLGLPATTRLASA
ncbi:MAG: winged helix DNA-binding domain-containing protein, partial [Candidatus Dormibacteraeota bacterium]|nr:winged helix DNA-binding domain-containing protein [Candidatus Dormibacteraeota bacterium]